MDTNTGPFNAFFYLGSPGPVAHQAAAVGGPDAEELPADVSN